MWKDPPVEAVPEQVSQFADATAVTVPAVVSNAGEVFQGSPQGGAIAPLNAWPWWFWPGVGGAVVLGVLILVLRLLLHSGGDEPQSANAVATSDSTQSESYATPAASTTSETTLTPNQATGDDAAKPVVDATTPQTTADATKDNKPDTEKTAAPRPVGNTASDNASDKTAEGAAPKTTGADETKSPESQATADKPMENAPTGSEPAAGALPIVPPSPAPTADAASATAQSSEAAPTTPPASEQQPAPRTLKRVPPRSVNVEARLADKVPGIEVQSQPLIDFLELISAMSMWPITVDVDAFNDFNQSVAAPVQLNMSDASVANILETALKPLQLSYQVRDGQVIVGYPAQDKFSQTHYKVNDLVGDDTQTLGELGALVRRMIAPGSWQQVGGKGSMVVGSGELLVAQSQPVKSQILDFCEKLRVARGLPLKSRYDASRFVLNTREDKVREMLGRPINANFAVPTSLAEAVKWLRHATDAMIVIDHAALARDGTSAESECEGLAVNKPLEKLLDELTGSADLTWRVIDERTIEITTRSAALEQMDVEFYPVRDLASSADAGEKLIGQVRSQVEPQFWGDAVDQAAQHGAMVFDKPSGALIVRAPQRTQALVETQLTALRSKK